MSRLSSAFPLKKVGPGLKKQGLDQRSVPSNPGSVRVGLVVERRYLSQLQPAGLIAALEARGCAVDVIDPGASMFRLGDDSWLEHLDVIVCRGRSVGVLTLLRWAEARGIRCINRRASIEAVLNKAQMAVELEAGGVRTPASFVGPVAELAENAPSGAFPLILKPVFGDNCAGLRIVANAGELAESDWPEPVALAQSVVPDEADELKLYGIGEQVWAVRKPSCLGGARTHDIAHTIPVTEAMRELALRCARIFDLELWGVDCIDTAQGIVVIEVNEFPNYTGIPEADERLADYVASCERPANVGVQR